MDGKETVISCGKVSIEPDGEGGMVFKLKGDLDHHSVKELREIIDGKLIDYRPLSVTLELSGVTFTDSAGLGLILGRYTRISGYGGRLRLSGVSEEFMKILRLAGTDRFIEIGMRKKGKEQTAI